MPNLIGHSLGRYHLVEQLGEGGMATVYKAFDTRLERDVAVKILRTEQFSPAQMEQVLQRFDREAKSLGKLSHPNIVSVLDYGEHESIPYLVMEFLPGGTLKQKLGSPLPWQEATRILLPVARALAYAHQRGIIHRDVKPANILLKETGEPVLTDFGIAKLLEAVEGHTLTASGVGIGTPEYMAPEQGMGAKVDARVDVYALGIVFYELVTGRKPYIADTPMAVLLKHITDPLPFPHTFAPNLPDDVEKVLIKALAKQPEDRYQTMDEFAMALEKLGQNLPLPVHPNIQKPPEESAPTKVQVLPSHPQKRLPGKAWRWGLIGVVGVLAIIGIIGITGQLIRQVPAKPIVPATSAVSATPTASAMPVVLPSPSKVQATPVPAATNTTAPTPRTRGLLPT